VMACSMDEHAEEKRTENILIVRSGISEAETTNNKRLRSTFCIEAIQTRRIVRPLCDSRPSYYKRNMMLLTTVHHVLQKYTSERSVANSYIFKPNTIKSE